MWEYDDDRNTADYEAAEKLRRSEIAADCRMAEARTRNTLLLLGLCTVCGEHDLVSGTDRCEFCRERWP